MTKCEYDPIETFDIPIEGVRLDLGCADRSYMDFVGVDICSPKAHVLCDFNEGLPFADGSVKFIRCAHVLEHVDNLFGLMDECWRVLTPNPACQMLVQVPRGDHPHSWIDPEHKRFFHPNTFVYFTPLWHYENRVKKWEVLRICWCSDQEITVLMRPIKTQEMMDFYLKQREEYRKKLGHNFIMFTNTNN